MNKPQNTSRSSSTDKSSSNTAGSNNRFNGSCPTDVTASASGAHTVHVAWTPPFLPPHLRQATQQQHEDGGGPSPLAARAYALQWRSVVAGYEGRLAPWSEATVKAHRVVKVMCFGYLNIFVGHE
jgi:hypothetical protein